MHDFEHTVLEWMQSPFDTATQEEVRKLRKDPAALEDAFYKNLAFGTGGMRGKMGVGTNRINQYTIGKNTQGLSNYLKICFPNEQIKAVVAYDCRHNSSALAKTVADVFTANGIKCFLFSELRTTPELSFAVRHLKAHCGIVLTASHNPPEYNGYKVYWQDGGQIVPPHDTALSSAIERVKFEDVLFAPRKELLELINTTIDKAYQKVVVSLAAIGRGNRNQLTIVFTPLHGTSITAIPQVLEQAGYKHIYLVEEQANPDGNFPTVSSPNPEEPQALAMAIEKGLEIGADIVFGTDPDSDRLGIAVRNKKGNFVLLNGNQMMVVMTQYLLDYWQRNGRITGNQFIATTIVSTPLLSKMAKSYGVGYQETLTGFKWIGKRIHDYPNLEFIGGGEESFGYLIGDQVRDKDAVSAALLACEMASDLKETGSTLMNLLEDCYRKYGFYQERLVSITKEGKEGLKSIENTMKDYRKKPPQKIAGISVVSVEDYQTSVKKNFGALADAAIDLPISNVLLFHLADDSKIALRPSGTEPKIKFYFSVNQPFDSTTSWEQQQEKLNRKIDRLQDEMVKI